MINAQIVAHSKPLYGQELISVLVTFPRIILAEVNTHRMLSKNTSSSRAIPFKKMVEAIQENPFIPIAWQKEHKGMQGTEYFTDEFSIRACEQNWLVARDKAILMAKHLNEAKVTKQLCNRLLEPFMWTTMLITGSKEGWDNFFNLRCPEYEFSSGNYNFKSKSWKGLLNQLSDKADDLQDMTFDESKEELQEYDVIQKLQYNKGQAEIHMMDLAEKIYDAINESTPKLLKEGEWHIPFIDKLIDRENIKSLINPETNLPVTEQEVINDNQDTLIEMSTAMCARTSYTIINEEKKIDYFKMIELHDRLISQNPPHSSPMEHCARAMNKDEYNSRLYKSKGENGWCRNFKGFIQYRHIIESKTN